MLRDDVLGLQETEGGLREPQPQLRNQAGTGDKTYLCPIQLPGHFCIFFTKRNDNFTIFSKWIKIFLYFSLNTQGEPAAFRHSTP